jgi:membrane protease YdiL (CAAX protease family)
MSRMQVNKTIKDHIPLVITFSTSIIIFLAVFIFSKSLNIKHNLTLLLLQQIIFIGPVLFFLLNKTYTLKDLGFNKISIPKTISHILLAFLSYFALMFAIHYITSIFNVDIPGFGQQQSYEPIFQGLKLPVIIVLASIIAPICEEILFRGLIFKQILFSNSIKIIFTAILFSIVHFQPTIIIPLFLIGCILGLLRASQNSIYPPIIFHIINNFLAVIVTTQLI